MPESHDEGVKRILAKAEQRKKSFRDSKDYCSIDDIMILLDAGAEPVHLNVKQACSSNYVHQVRYEGFQFVSASDEIVAAFDFYLLRRN